MSHNISAAVRSSAVPAYPVDRVSDASMIIQRQADSAGNLRPANWRSG
jgi:hypothetical protein